MVFIENKKIWSSAGSDVAFGFHVSLISFNVDDIT